MTKIVAVAASGRRAGNSEMLLEAALDVLRARGCDVDIVAPSRISVTPCQACGGCTKTGRCVIEDAAQGLFVKFAGADHIIVATPIYFGSIPGTFKVLIDRFQCYWERTFRLGEPVPGPRRRGMVLITSGQDVPKHAEHVRSIVANWMACLNMTCTEVCHFPGLEEVDDVAERPEYLNEARAAALRMLDGEG
jgi:multimeric flavodoxin WrbA